MKNVQRFLALALALCMVLSIIPPVEVNAATVTPAAKEESNLMVNIAPGDSTWVAESIPMWTVESLNALLDLYQDNGVTRIFWRGLQHQAWNETQYNLQNGIRSTYHFEGVRQQFLEIEARVGMTVDEYLVQEAHKRGMEVYGTASLADFGSGFDIPISSWPCVHNMVQRMENPDWVPKDKYGLVEQGGALEFSLQEVRDWFVDFHVGEIEKAGYDGIFYITYSENYSLNYNNQFGYSDEAVQEFYNRYGIIAGKEPFTRYASINDWQMLRGEYITELFREMRAALDATGLEDVKMSLFLDSRDPWHFQGWSPAQGLLSDGIYLDLFTYVREDLIDQFICQGACSWDAQIHTATNMLQMCEGTDIDVAIYTSSANDPVWDELRAQGVDRVTNVSHEAMMYNRAFNGGEDSPVLEERAVRQWLAQLAEGYSTLNLAGTADTTLDDLTPYLFDQDENGVQGYKYSLTVRRMVVHAIKTMKPAGASDVLEQVLSTDPEPVVQAVAADALRYVGDLDSVDELIETLYRQHEFAIIEATVISLYSNANKTAWQASLRSAFEKYAANNFDNCNTSNVRACANILRALSASSHIDLDFYSQYVETFGPNNSIEVLLDYELSEVQYRREPGAALEVMDDVMQELWYDALRYWAAMGVANSNTGAGFEKLFELALGDDSITSTAALVSIGNRGRSSAMVGEYRTRALEVMDQVFGACGDGSERDDRDWLYRPLGDALKNYGDEGVAILEKYLNGDDKILALYAWRDLYHPWTPGSYNEMTEVEYEEAYLQLPDSLKEFTTDSLKQGFEDKEVFNQSSTGTVGNIQSTQGSWGSFNAGGMEVSDFVREGSSGTQSVKLVRDGGTASTLTGRFPELLDGQSYHFSFWVYRTNGGIFTINSRNAVSDHEFQAFVRQGGDMVFYDNEAKAWGTEPVFTVPENQWVQLTFAVSRLKGELTVSMTTEDGVTQTADTKLPVYVASGVDRIQVSMSTVSGGTAYVDDFSILTATPVLPVRSAGTSISLEDAIVRYDGTAHALTATTNLMGDTVPTVTYKNAYAVDAEATTEAPVDAGTYLVTATAEYEGETYTAEATLTIAPATPTFDSTMVTVENITYGQKLNEAVLTMEAGALTDINGDALTGNIVWNNGGQYPVEKGTFSYTVNSDNKNYASVVGTIVVDVTEPSKQPVYETTVTKLMEQNFDDTSIFALSNYTDNLLDPADYGGEAVDGSSFNIGGDVVTLVTEGDNQYYSVRRKTGDASGLLYCNMVSSATAGLEANYEWSMKLKTDTATYMLLTIGKSSGSYEMSFNIGPDSITSMEDDTKAITIPKGEWATVTFQVDREAGTYTFSCGDSSATVSTAKIGTVDVERIIINGRGNRDTNYLYIDDVLFTTTETVEVDTTEYETIVKLSQDFEDLTFAASGANVVAGDKATTGGQWTRINSSVEDADLITTQNDSKVVGIYRDGTQKNVSVEVADGFAAGQDFTFSFDYYAIGYGMTVYLNDQPLFYVKTNSKIAFYDPTAKNWVETDLTISVNQWVNLRTDVAADGSVTLTMTDAAGEETVAVSENLSIEGCNAISFNGANNVGLTGYIDNVKLYRTVVVEDGPQYAYTALMEQDFDNTDIFSLDNYTDNVLNPADFGGEALDGASFNIIGDITTLVTEEDGNQYYSVRRLTDDTGGQYYLHAVSSASAGTKSCYEWSVDIKTATDTWITLGFGKGSSYEMSFILAPNYIQSVEDSSKQLTFTQGEWTTFKFWADRDAGTYTFSVGEQSATVTTDLIGSYDVNQFSVNGRGARADNYVYIDNVSFSKADLLLPYEIVDVTISDTVQAYTGSAKGVSVSAGAAEEYTVWYNGSTDVPTEIGTYEVQVLVTEKGYRGSAMGTLTIEQAIVATEGEALTYVEVANGATLEAIDLGISFGASGTFAWDDDAAAALRTSGWYDWSFIPENSNYATVSGSIYVNVQGGDDAVAQVGDTTYASLVMAIQQAAAGSTVTMIGNASEAGFDVTKNITVDFAGKSLSVTSGTVSFSEGAVVELKNGTIAGSGMLLQNAANLTLTDMVLSTSGTAIFNGPERVLNIRYTNAPEAVTVTGGIIISDASTVSISGGIYTAKLSDSWCAESYQAVQLADGNWTVMHKDLCNAAKIGNVYYADLEAAVEAAADGQTITMLKDVDLGYLVLTGTKTLDLNGHTLAAAEGVITFAGQIIDSTDGTGLLVTAPEEMILSSANVQLPLYDSAVGGYRFFGYSFKTLGAYTDSASGCGVYGLRLLLQNEDGYALLGSADSGMTVKVTLTWDGMTSQAPSFTFSSNVMAEYAGKIADIPAYALLVKVTGAEGKAVTLTPVIETVCRMEATASAVTHTANAAE